MKKTLIAMAAVAVAGVASAQTITGEYGFGYISDKAVTKNNGKTLDAKTVSGLAQTDGSISISATEDLGGGMTLAGSTTVDLKGRTSVAAENATLTLSGGFGSLTLGSVELGNGILGLGGAGVAGRGLDNKVALDGGTNIDMVKFQTPALMEGLTASMTRAEITPGAGDGAGQATVVGVNFASGALTLAVDTANYSFAAPTADIDAADSTCNDPSMKKVAVGTACPTGYDVLVAGTKLTDKAAQLAAQVDQRQRLSFSYDLGMAKVGYGYQKKSYNGTGKDNTQTVMGLNVPMGAMSIGVAMSTNKTDGSAKTKGTDVGINYALSKRTTLNFSNMRTKEDGKVADTYQRLRLKTTF
jgi:hypothetical protein